MPDKQNENKFMAMLERRGIVRKADTEEEQPETAPGPTPSRPEADILTLFGSPTSDTLKVTPASRQPVPGISNPILPGEQQQNTQREQPRQVESKVATLPKEEVLRAADLTGTERFGEQDELAAGQSRSAAIQRAEQNRMRESMSSDDFSEEYDTFPDNSGQNAYAADAEGSGAQGNRQPPAAVDYTDRYLDIDDLYEVLSLKSKRTDTIYLVEEYLKSLPDSLPDESRREIVGKIVAASGFDYDLLMGDGVLRVKMLKEYAERFALRTDDYVAARQSELDELDQQIIRIRKLIENRRELHKKQFFAIEAEAQRLKDILTFISG